MLSDEVEMNYDAVLEDLESRLQAGQAAFEAWEGEKAELHRAIAAIQAIAARQGTARQMSLPLAGAGRATGALPAGAFRGLSYNEATRKAFSMFTKPLGAPDVANLLYKAGYSASRKKIKSNVDGIFKRLRDAGVIERVDDTSTYVLTETNGNGNHG